MTAKFELFKDTGGKFRFHLKAANGEIIAASQGYTSKAAAHANGHVRLLVGGQFAPVGRTRFLRISGHENSGSAAAKQLIDTLA